MERIRTTTGRLLGNVLDEQDVLRRRIAEALRARTRQRTNPLVVHRVRSQAIAEYVRDAGSRLGSTADEVRATVGILMTACDALAPPGTEAAADRTRPVDRARAEFVRDALWGTLDTRELADAAAVHGVDLTRRYFAVRGRPDPDRGVDELVSALGLGRGRPGRGLCAVVDGDLVGFVAVPPSGAVGGMAGVGLARPPALLHESFRMASRALRTAVRCGMTGVCEFGSLGLLPAVLSDEATGSALCHRYFTPLGDGEFTTEIVETLEAYLRHGMHAPRTAQALCVHPNTVRYRIGKFEELTGLSLRQDGTAVFEVLWAMEHRRAHRAHRAADG